MPAGRVLAIFALSLLAACSHGGDDAPSDIPEGAVEVREGYYMVPVTKDEDGCQMYRAYAPGMLTDQAIRYQRADGSFTVNKEEAACDGRS